MAWYEILIVSVGLSLDVLTYALYKGAMLSKLDKKQILKMTLLFTGWQSGAMLLGSLISEIPYIIFLFVISALFSTFFVYFLTLCTNDILNVL